jgi:hypothetical protein
MNQTTREEMEHLLLGYGFNFYRIENQLRADDLLVRQRAGAALGHAAARLDQLARQFQRTCIPAPTRDSPFPPADAMERLNAIRRSRQRVMDQNSFLQGMPAPAQDQIWRRLRDEQTLLESLINADIAMLRLAGEVEAQAQSLSAQGWKSPDAGTGLEAACERWDAAIRARQELLQIGVRA